MNYMQQQLAMIVEKCYYFAAIPISLVLQVISTNELDSKSYCCHLEGSK